MLADCSLRAASVTSDYGEFVDAAELARVAMLVFVELGDDTGTGKALVSRGIFLQRGCDHYAAIRCLLSALSKLPSGERNNRFACHLTLGAANVSVGDIDAASRHAATAKQIGAPADGLTHLRWLRAKIAVTRKDFARATHLYERSAVALQGSPVDAALVGAELARCYLEARRPSDALDTAKGLAALAMPWRSNRLVDAAIRDLWCSAREGEMSLTVLDRIIRRIQHARDRRAMASPRPA